MSQSDSDSGESYYNILELGKTASLDDIKRKKRELSVKYHPDKQPDDKKVWGETMIKKVNEACDILSNPEKRKMYDKYGKDGLSLPAGFGEPGWSPTDILFPHQQRPQVQQIQIKTNITLEEIFAGKKVTQEIDRFSLCKQCDHTGFTDKQSHICKSCNGKGTKIMLKQLGPGRIQQLRMECDICRGSGSGLNSSNKCKSCNGNKIIRESHTVTFDIDPGVHKNDVIEVKDEGHEIASDTHNYDCQRGDVICLLNEVPHAIFKRGVEHNGRTNPANMGMTMQIELHEALCGFTRQIKYLDGTDIYIDQYDPIRDGDIKVVENKGLPYKGRQYKSGDLFITFKVMFPEHLTATTKSKMYELLTGKKFNAKKIHTFPNDILPAELKNMADYTPSETYYEEDTVHNQQEQDGVQCATQ